jgi:predicted metal-dependent peptidase
MKGGGGTSFIPVFDELKKTKCTPSILIYFTDGYGNFPEVSPKRYPVLWVLTENHQDPPWGRTTVIRVGGE